MCCSRQFLCVGLPFFSFLNAAMDFFLKEISFLQALMGVSMSLTGAGVLDDCHVAFCCQDNFSMSGQDLSCHTVTFMMTFLCTILPLEPQHDKTNKMTCTAQQ